MQTKPFIILRDMESADAVSIRWKKSRISMSDIIKNGHNEIKNKYYLGRIKRDLTNFFKWMALAILTGVVVGGASSVFAICIRWVTAFRADNKWMFLLLPVAGLIIVFMYQRLDKNDGGTNQVLSTIRSKDDVPLKSAPLI